MEAMEHLQKMNCRCLCAMERPAVHAVSVTAASTSVFHFRFEGYSLAAKAAGSGQFYQSDPFDAGGHRWAVRFFPNGYLHTRVMLLPVLLSRAAEPDGGAVRATFTGVLLDWSGEPSPDDEDSLSQAFVAGDGEQASRPLTFRKAVLDDFLYADCFVVRCTVCVLKRPRVE